MRVRARAQPSENLACANTHPHVRFGTMGGRRAPALPRPHPRAFAGGFFQHWINKHIRAITDFLKDKMNFVKIFLFYVVKSLEVKTHAVDLFAKISL